MTSRVRKKDPVEARALIEGRLSQPLLADAEAIDRGGMGIIERVRDTRLEREMARKVLAPRLQDDPQSVRYFLREACITARLAHPAVVPVHALELDERDRLNFTMKLVEGMHLGHRVKALPEGRLDDATLFEFLGVIERVCEALELAHASGIIHRDLKPDNVMVGKFGAVYLMDWGVAAATERAVFLPAELMIDDSGVAVGTPGYMAPEQATGIEPDARTDVFGVGGLLYYILTRRAPHRGKTVMQVLQRAAYEAVVPPSELIEDGHVPRALESIVMRALAFSPEDRYPSVSALVVDLRRFMRGGGDFPRVSYAKGQHVVHEGALGDSAFIITKGRFEVYREVDGDVHALRVMGRGEVFGEMAILGSGRRTASVVAVEDGELLVVTRETLQREVDDMKPWVGAIVRSLAQRFEQREAELLQRRSADRRAASATPSHGPDVRRIFEMVLMIARALVGDLGARAELPFLEVASRVEAFSGVDRWRLAQALEGHPNFELHGIEGLMAIRRGDELLETLDAQFRREG